MRKEEESESKTHIVNEMMVMKDGERREERKIEWWKWNLKGREGSEKKAAGRKQKTRLERAKRDNERKKRWTMRMEEGNSKENGEKERGREGNIGIERKTVGKDGE